VAEQKEINIAYDLIGRSVATARTIPYGSAPERFDASVDFVRIEDPSFMLACKLHSTTFSTTHTLSHISHGYHTRSPQDGADIVEVDHDDPPAAAHPNANMLFVQLARILAVVGFVVCVCILPFYL
jgi:hypothetical protein